jgi:hypothetical protein
MGVFRRHAKGQTEKVTDVLGEWEYNPDWEGPTGALYWLQAWYAVHCDDEWEHGFGVSIDTLDNPGWHVKIDTRGTALEGQAFEPVDIERGDHDWLKATAQDGVFEAYCGPLNLGEVLDRFRGWAQRPVRAKDS